MIKKLRRKFITINMLLVTCVLAAVLTLLCLFSFHRYQMESSDALHRIISMRSDSPPPKLQRTPAPDRETPFTMPSAFVVTLKKDGSVDRIISSQSTQIDEAFALEAVQAMRSLGKDQGKLQELQLAFLMDGENSDRIAFVDLSQELRSKRNLLLTCLLILLAASAAFFAVSLFLSRWALRPVEQAWDQQNQFIADASHELKTPLTVILANLKILLAHREDTIDHQLRWIENTKAEAGRMKELVENLLFLARAEANTLPSSRETVPFSDLVWSCLLPMESLAFEQGVTIREDIVPDLQVPGNPGQLKQLLVILLDNACKYADKEKQVSISVSPVQDKLLLSVHNTGLPIPKEELPHLFERFYRSDKSRVRKKGGYGLGLSIARMIVQQHGGKITVESTEEAGTAFQIQLPLRSSKNT